MTRQSPLHGRPEGRANDRLGIEVYSRIRDAILAGELLPGTPLSRRRLAESLSVSTLPVASAMHRLEAEGFVESRPRAGTRVKIPSVKEIRGNYILREALETQAARMFAETASTAERTALIAHAKRLDARYQRAGSAKSWMEAEKLHVAFHGRIARATKCDELVQAIDRSRVLLFNWLFSHSGNFQPLPPRWHSGLAAKVAAKDPHAAAEAMRVHVRFRMQEIVRHYAVLSSAAQRGRIVRGPQRRSLAGKGIDPDD